MIDAQSLVRLVDISSRTANEDGENVTSRDAARRGRLGRPWSCCALRERAHGGPVLLFAPREWTAASNGKPWLRDGESRLQDRHCEQGLSARPRRALRTMRQATRDPQARRRRPTSNTAVSMPTMLRSTFFPLGVCLETVRQQILLSTSGNFIATGAHA
jgi:hypothetical protein